MTKQKKWFKRIGLALLALVLALVLAGHTNQQIAEALVVSVGTVKTHVYNIVHKCDVGNRAELKTLFWAP